MLSPGSAVSRDSIISALINNFLDPELGQLSLDLAASKLQSIYMSDLRAYFYTKPFYKFAGYMDFPSKVKEIYQNLDKLTEQTWNETVGFAALEQIVKLLDDEASNNPSLPISTKFIAQLLSLDHHAVNRCLMKDPLCGEFKHALEAAVKAKQNPTPVTFSNPKASKPAIKKSGSGGSGSCTPVSSATDIEEFQYEPPICDWHCPFPISQKSSSKNKNGV